MATPELGHRMYGYTLFDCIVESQECSNCKQCAKHNANSERVHSLYTLKGSEFRQCSDQHVFFQQWLVFENNLGARHQNYQTSHQKKSCQELVHTCITDTIAMKVKGKPQ